MMRLLQAWLVAGTAIPIAMGLEGCVAERSATGSTVVDSAGVSIITSSTAAWEPGAARIDTAPLVRTGSDESDPNQFSYPWRGILLPGGGFAVAEVFLGEIRLFAADGRHQRTLGRKGKGPGEFEVISFVALTPGDSIAAYDQSSRRLTIFPADGGGRRVVANTWTNNLDAFGTTSGGDILLYNPGTRPRGLTPGLTWDTTDVVLMRASDGAARSLVRLPSRERFVTPDGHDTRPHAPAHVAVHAGDGAGFYWASSDRYSIEYRTLDGTLTRILRRPVEPAPVTAADKETWVKTNLAEVRRLEGEAAMPMYQQVMETMPWGSTRPLFDNALVDGNGRLWLGHSDWPALPGVNRRWSVFGRDGTWLGDLDAPPDFRILDVRDGLVLGVHQEEGEAPRVQVHRLTTP